MTAKGLSLRGFPKGSRGNLNCLETHKEEVAFSLKWMLGVDLDIFLSLPFRKAITFSILRLPHPPSAGSQ
jgi:hypothetical protein